MKNRYHIIHFTSAVAVALGLQGAMLCAEPDAPVFIHPGDPTVHPGDDLTQPSFDNLIPTTYPVIQAGEPEVHNVYVNVMHPVDQPLVPTGAP